jgi:hypothetical protein
VDTAPGSATQNAGSYGHILESLITSRMADVSARSTDIGTMYTYVSRIGYAMFKLDRRFLSAKEVSELHSQYCLAYKMNLPEVRVVADLVEAKILIKDGDSFRFRYRGCYCYFVARYFSENLGSKDPTLRAELNEITDKLVWDDYTNILMFFLYLTKDADIIERLLSNASNIYRECEPCDLENDVAFVNKLLTEKPNKLVLPSTNIASNRDQFRREQDAGGFQDESETLQTQRVPYDSGLSEIIKINISLQSLRVMGQVLRNFPGVLTAEPKYRLAEASYLLGLRTLRRLLELAQSQMEALRTAFAQTFKDKHPLATQEEVEKSADETLIWLTGAVSYGIIKKICRSIGLQDLELTFQEVLEKHGNRPSVQLVDLSIKLEHFRDAPEADISDLEKGLRRNLFSYKILRQLVAEYLYLYNTDRILGQKLGDLFEIKVSDPRFLLNKAVGSGE